MPGKCGRSRGRGEKDWMLRDEGMAHCTESKSKGPWVGCANQLKNLAGEDRFHPAEDKLTNYWYKN